MRNVILCGDVRERLADLESESVHCVVTSPPYWGLRDYGVAGQVGLEVDPDAYVRVMVDVFREVRRVLRRDGTCWVNLGDSYAGGPSGTRGNTTGFRNGQEYAASYKGISATGLKPKDLCGIPWRVAFALQADGWWLRSDIIWSKPNPMPESVTDRPTKSHEYLFLLSKSSSYYYDAEAIKEASIEPNRVRNDPVGGASWVEREQHSVGAFAGGATQVTFATRNRRTVWEIATEPYAEAHFATFPTELVKPCILAGTSEHGCCSECGAPWQRVTEVQHIIAERNGKTADKVAAGLRTALSGATGPKSPTVRTLGWQPTCKHEAPLQPAIVLDPFGGSGTVGQVAKTAGRDYVLIELNPAYVAMAEKRIGNQERLL